MSQQENFRDYLFDLESVVYTTVCLEYIRKTLKLSSHDDSYVVCGDDNIQEFSTRRAASRKIGRGRKV